MTNNQYKFKYILLDVSNIFRRTYSIRSKLLEKSVNKINVYNETVKHTLISISKLEKDFLSDTGIIYYLFDNPKSRQNIRLELSEDYKNNRVKMPEGYYKALDHLALILQNRNNNYKLIRVPFLEADDLTKPLIEQIRLTDKINNILLCSADFDYARNITRDNLWYNFDEVITYESFNAKYNYYPSESSVTLYKTIKGDKSDCIPNAVIGVHEKDILPLITKYRDIYSLLGNIYFESLSDKWKKAFKDNEKQLRINYQLVNFIETSYEEIKEYITESKLSVSLLKDLYHTITTNIKEIDKRDIFFEAKVSSNGFFDDYKLERL